MSPGSAKKQAGEHATAAVLDILTPICVERFNLDGDKEAKLKALKKKISSMRDDYVTEQGWATMPGDGQADLGVAQAGLGHMCALSCGQVHTS